MSERVAGKRAKRGRKQEIDVVGRGMDGIAMRRKRAEVFGLWAVVDWGDKATVTHVPTGLAMAWRANVKEARDLARRLEADIPADGIFALADAEVLGWFATHAPEIDTALAICGRKRPALATLPTPEPTP